MSRMPLGPFTRASALRAAGVVVITAAVTIAAACSDEDTVDTVPPPRPGTTQTPAGPQGVPPSLLPGPLPTAGQGTASATSS